MKKLIWDLGGAYLTQEALYKIQCAMSQEEAKNMLSLKENFMTDFRAERAGITQTELALAEKMWIKGYLSAHCINGAWL